MYLFEAEATFEADPATVWKVWTDVDRWPEWDVSKEIARLDGPFEPGVSGWAKQRGNLGGAFTITIVDAGHRYDHRMPDAHRKAGLRPCGRPGRQGAGPGGQEG